MRSPISISYVIDPRFSGGTSSAIASELKVVSQFGHVTIHAISSEMFKGKFIAQNLRNTLRELRLQVIWDAPTINADIVLLHNPSFLKFQSSLNSKIITKHLIIVTHENFLRPGQIEAFDVSKCLGIIDRATLALKKSIAPISPCNRKAVSDWMKLHPQHTGWHVLKSDWFNICDFQLMPPTSTPADRRGRHSRPGIEKFPNITDMDICFPSHSESNVILGADIFLQNRLYRPHWKMLPFQSVDVARFFEMIDFMVYFTAPTWRESFGRVLAEAIAAGKVVISDPETASIFQGAVLSAQPVEIGAMIRNLVANPALYQKHVVKAQKSLEALSTIAFKNHFQNVLNQMVEVPA